MASKGVRMEPKKPNLRATQVTNIIDLSPHLRRIIVTGDALKGFPVGQEGVHVKVFLPTQGHPKKRSYTIRSFDPETLELAMDFVINRHQGPATNWAKNAKIGDPISIAGPGSMKITQFDHHSYLLIGDITSINAINGYVPRFNPQADIRVIISVPTRYDIIDLDYEKSINTQWYIEDEITESLEDKVQAVAQDMAKDTQVFMGLEARSIRSLRPILQKQLGFDRLNIFAVGYWKKGVDADKFNAQKKVTPL